MPALDAGFIALSFKKNKHEFLSIIISGNAKAAGLYTAQYEQVFDVLVKKESRGVIEIKAPVKNITEPGKNEMQQDKSKRPQIHYFAGPHSVFNSRFR